MFNKLVLILGAILAKTCVTFKYDNITSYASIYLINFRSRFSLALMYLTPTNPRSYSYRNSNALKFTEIAEISQGRLIAANTMAHSCIKWFLLSAVDIDTYNFYSWHTLIFLFLCSLWIPQRKKACLQEKEIFLRFCCRALKIYKVMLTFLY